MKAAIYLRVSTDKQTIAAQREELIEICRRRRWADVAEYSDVISGAKFTRTGLERMMDEIRRGRLDVVLCTSWTAWAEAWLASHSSLAR